jgi:uncharacterized protein (TIGR02246 family)
MRDQVAVSLPFGSQLANGRPGSGQLVQLTAKDVLKMTHHTAVGKMSTATHASDLALIRELWFEYTSALMSGDIDRWISLWSPGGIEIQPAGLLLSGIKQIQAAHQPLSDLFNTEITILPENIHIRGECAYAYGSYKHTLTPKEGGELISDAGMFLTILEKQANTSWKIAITLCSTTQ